jgi:hypothetical protein
VLVDGLVDHAGIEGEVGDRSVAVAAGALRVIHRLVDLEWSPGTAFQRRQEVSEPFLVSHALEQSRGGDGTRIDHRVEGSIATLVEDDGVEGVAARLDADLLQHLRGSVILEREPIDERLRDRLDREDVVRVAHLVHVPIGSRQRDPESSRIGVRERGDVGGDTTIVIVPKPVVDLP